MGTNTRIRTILIFFVSIENIWPADYGKQEIQYNVLPISTTHCDVNGKQNIGVSFTNDN